jgi:hypothetical protein
MVAEGMFSCCHRKTVRSVICVYFESIYVATVTLLARSPSIDDIVTAGRALRPIGKIRRAVVIHTEEKVTMTPVSLTSSDLSSTKPAPLDRAKQLAAALLSERGEASGALVARQLQGAVGALDASGRHRFELYLAAEFQPDKAALRAAAERYLAEGTAEAAAPLAQAADPPRQELLRRMNMAPGGTGALIAMRDSHTTARRTGIEAARCRSLASVRLMVQSRVSRIAAYRLANAGGGAGKADRLRSGARDQGLGRPAATACA